LKISAFYLDKQKSFIPKKILSVPYTMGSSVFSQQMPYCLATLLVYMALVKRGGNNGKEEKQKLSEWS
jgi:hypothetical protein